MREAITAANTNTASGASPGECEAGLSSGSDAIDMTSITGTINLTGALPNLAGNMAISGSGSSQLTVNRNTGGDYRIFTVSSSVTVTISGVLVSNGKTPDVGGAASNGGGILNSGTLTLNDVVVTGNQTGAGNNSGLAGSNGGGIANTSTLVMTNCAVTGNTAGSANAANGGSGGGIYSTGSLTLTNSTIAGNQAGSATGFVGNGGDGGGVYCSGGCSLTSVTISNNQAGTDVGNDSFGGHGGGVFVPSKIRPRAPFMKRRQCAVVGRSGSWTAK